MEKKYPPTVTLRKGIAGAAIALVIVIVGIIFYNIRMTSQHQAHAPANVSADKRSAKINAMLPDNKWYEDQTVRKVLAAPPAATTSGLTQRLQQHGVAVAETVSARVRQTGIVDDELRKAMYAPISVNQINDASASNANFAVRDAAGASGVTTQQSSAEFAQRPQQQLAEDPNLQSIKKDFLAAGARDDKDAKDAVYLHKALKNAISPYELKASAIIPAILLTGINSDLPGQITAQVRANVFDTIAGKYVLIPQGAKLTGLYDSQVAYGQRRVLVVWQRVIFPNGQSISLEGMSGVDMSGYAGFHDQVDNHYFKIFGSVILMSVISAGAQLSQPQQQANNNAPLSVNQTLAASLGTNIMNTTNAITQKNLGIQPTLVIRPGYLFNVSVAKDIVFPGEYDERTSYGG